MDELDPMAVNELFFPGAVTGASEVKCSHNAEQLKLQVDGRLGKSSLVCCECGGLFDADLADRTVSWNPKTR